MDKAASTSARVINRDSEIKFKTWELLNLCEFCLFFRDEVGCMWSV
jgi:hypothetical protein